jgi:acetyltransferase-like isoleucine patch superfamily enzyme
MTFLSIILSFFPAFTFLVALGAFLWLLIQPGILSFFALVSALYLWPLTIYRIHQFFYPIPLGLSDLTEKNYSPWWGSQQIQLIYNTFPSLEKILHLFPGLFSIWLRLWGAKVGKNVYWVPSVRIVDRSLIAIGDNVILGHLVITCSHVIKPKGDKLLLYVQPIKIGDNAFVGAQAKLGPGAWVEAGAFIPYNTELWGH